MLLTSEYFIVTLFGLIIGSFTNTIIYRIPRNLSIILPKSFCPHCAHQILFYDLIPIISFIKLHGKCRYCKKKIGFQYLVVEALMTGIFIATFYQWGLTFQTLSGWVLAVVIVSAAVIDMNWGIIPNKITYPSLVIGLLLSFVTIGIYSSIAGGLFFSGVLLLAAYCYRGAMGGGDIKIALVIGVFTGFQGAIIAFILAVFLGALYGMMLIIFGMAEYKTSIKFGPFLAAGAFISYNFSTELIQIYLTLF
jgi:leader peptidase (prepilin peptidase)/N-methyltransferase